MDDKEMQGMLEKASLLPERWYLVFRQGNDDDHVMMTAYDTTTDDEHRDRCRFKRDRQTGNHVRAVTCFRGFRNLTHRTIFR